MTPVKIGYIGLLVGSALLAGIAIFWSDLAFIPSNERVRGLTISEYDTQGFLLVFLALVVIAGYILIPRMASGLDSKFLLVFLWTALVAKMLGSLGRLLSTIYIYGFRDAAGYDKAGETIGNSLRSLDFASALPFLRVGTDFTQFYTGIMYAFIGPTVYGGFLVFAFLSFLGSFFCYKAFRTAFPANRGRFYAVLVFLYPSIVFWSSGLGKDALMALFIGLSAYGAAIVLTRVRWQGFLLLAMGVGGAITVRPQVGGIIVIALAAALLLRKGDGGIRSVAGRGMVLLASLVLAWQLAPVLQSYVGLDELSRQGVEGFFDYRQDTSGDSTEGLGAFEAPQISDPLFVPKAFVAVLFRPFLWEAHNLQALIQAADAALLLGLVIWKAPTIARAIFHSRADPYLIFVAVLVTGLVIALITIANFGTLARERVMILPLLLVLPAYQPSKKPVSQLGRDLLHQQPSTVQAAVAER